jgi:ABC-2 type transport system permease protein
MLLAGFRRQATYRLAAATGLVTNAFFGVVRTAIFLALYRQRGQVAGMDLGDALTYVWVLESLFGVIWVAWFWETAESIRSGDFVVELLRPGDLYLRLLAFDLGRSVNLLAVRALPAITVAALLLPLRLLGSPAWCCSRSAWCWRRWSGSSCACCSPCPRSGHRTTARCGT